jgi:hypothetical protein
VQPLQLGRAPRRLQTLHFLFVVVVRDVHGGVRVIVSAVAVAVAVFCWRFLPVVPVLLFLLLRRLLDVRGQGRVVLVEGRELGLRDGRDVVRAELRLQEEEEALEAFFWGVGCVEVARGQGVGVGVGVCFCGGVAMIVVVLRSGSCGVLCQNQYRVK